MNVLLIQTDRHNPQFSGCYGSPITRTPNIDSLAERGTRFDRAYCISPLCAPTRAAVMAGRYVHEIGTWSNAFPYTGVPKGWGHYFKEQGVHLTTIGKLDYDPEADHGIADVRQSKLRQNLNVLSCFREQDMPPRYLLLHRLRKTGPADSPQPFKSDDDVAEEATRWLADEHPTDRPWILSVNFTSPHPTWNPPKELWDHYDPLIKIEDFDERYTEDLSRLHPHHRTFIRHVCGDLVKPEELRLGHVGMHATTEAVDGNVGRVVNALDGAGLMGKTVVVYTSDHGGCCGEHRDWGIGSMYEDSIRVPIIVAGPGVSSGAVQNTPISHHDLYQTICEATGADLPIHTRGLSLWGLLRGEKDASRPRFTLSEYHAVGFPASIFAIRSGHLKYVEYVGERPSLFNLEDDPLEMHDLVLERPDDPETQANIRRLRRMLCEVCSPEAVDARAKADQRALRKEVTESGRILRELWRRGFERNPDELIPREDIIPEL
jgi:choline-sulfatase